MEGMSCHQWPLSLEYYRRMNKHAKCQVASLGLSKCVNLKGAGFSVRQFCL